MIEARNKVEQDFESLAIGPDIQDGVQNDLRFGLNSPTSPSDRDGITSASQYRTENLRNSPSGGSVAGGETLASNNAGIIATPVYTFILPDLTRYPGNISTATTLYPA